MLSQTSALGARIIDAFGFGGMLAPKKRKWTGVPHTEAKVILESSMLSLDATAGYTSLKTVDALISKYPYIVDVPYSGDQLMSVRDGAVLFYDGFSLRRLSREFRSGLLKLEPSMWHDTEVVNFPGKPEWCLLEKVTRRNTLGLSFDDGVRQLSPGFYVPTARQIATAAILKYGLRKKNLITVPVLTRTEHEGGRVIVWQDPSGGVHLGKVSLSYSNSLMGVAVAATPLKRQR